VKTIIGPLSNKKFSKSFNLCLEDKFFDRTVADTIYQFRLKDFGIYFIDDDIVVFVGKNAGIQGYYLGDIVFQKETNETEYIYFATRGNIYKDRPYFKRLVRKIIE